jgi:hypothetical protein
VENPHGFQCLEGNQSPAFARRLTRPLRFRKLSATAHSYLFLLPRRGLQGIANEPEYMSRLRLSDQFKEAFGPLWITVENFLVACVFENRSRSVMRSRVILAC